MSKLAVIRAAILALLTVSPAWADLQMGAWAEVSAETLNVRAAPSTVGAVRARIEQNERIFITPSGQPGWVFVRGDTATGYVSAEHVRIIRVTSGRLGDRRVSF